MNLVVKLLLGQEIVTLIYEYYQFKRESSDGGKILTRKEQLQLISHAIRIVEKLIIKLKIGEKK